MVILFLFYGIGAQFLEISILSLWDRRFTVQLSHVSSIDILSIYSAYLYDIPISKHNTKSIMYKIKS